MKNIDLNKENIEQLKYIKLLLKLDTPISKIKEFNSKKISSKENYKFCDLDKRYVDRFLRIIEN